MMQVMPICLMHTYRRTKSQTFASLPECDKNKNVV